MFPNLIKSTLGQVTANTEMDHSLDCQQIHFHWLATANHISQVIRAL